MVGDGACQRDQFGIVGRAHRWEARSQRVIIGADEGIVAEHVDVICDEHEITGGPHRMHAPARVGDHESTCAERAHDADGKGDFLKRVALIAMKAALHRDNALSTECADQ